MLPTLSSQLSQDRPSSFVPRPQQDSKLSAGSTQPIVIDDSDESESDGEQQLPFSGRRYPKPPNPFQRSSRLKTRAFEPVQKKTNPFSRIRRPQPGSPNGTRATFTEAYPFSGSSDVSYPDLGIALNKSGSRSRPFLQLSNGVLHAAHEQNRRVPGRRDRGTISRVQQPRVAEQGTSQTLSTTIMNSPKFAPSARPGSRNNPIDLDSWPEPEPMGLDASGNESCQTSDVGQASIDALMAHQLQEDEDRAQHVAPKIRECAVCGDQTSVGALPALSECEHVPRTCGSCYAGWVAAQLQDSGWREAKCPESNCQTRLQYYDIQHIASPDIFQQYDMFIARAALGEDPNFRWCRACSFGQVHMNGEEGNIFTCAACGHKVCIIHESTWHEGETCEEYEYRASRRQEHDRQAQESASLDAIGKLTKKCPGPNCVFNIEKNNGCDHMTCSRCRHEFCWICLCDYNNIRRQGNSAHAGTCKYHSGRLH
ncbi:hypothetical protein IQ06DRAFT_211228 [Phaeosphaeriaceae sp. SRC1lsM3a]|nr:hypothetical protein IQ06DRAFT_211228 [Stagonospora sp. SRC1lsM3a]